MSVGLKDRKYAFKHEFLAFSCILKSVNINTYVLSCPRVLYFGCLVHSWALKITTLEHMGVNPLHVEGCDLAIKWGIFLR